MWVLGGWCVVAIVSDVPQRPCEDGDDDGRRTKRELVSSALRPGYIGPGEDGAGGRSAFPLLRLGKHF